jgi:hypothetical protein
LDKLRADGWSLHLTGRQQAAVDNLLLESDSVNLFTRECLASVDGQETTVPAAFQGYVEFAMRADGLRSTGTLSDARSAMPFYAYIG